MTDLLLSFPKVQLDGVFIYTYVRKKKQGTSKDMGVVLTASQIQGFQTASDYDLDYTQPLLRDRIEKLLNQMRHEKLQNIASCTMFIRLPYETNEGYEERMRQLWPVSARNSAYRREYSQFADNVGLRKNRPKGVLPTAPVLPFLLYAEVVQSVHMHISKHTEIRWMVDEVLD